MKPSRIAVLLLLGSLPGCGRVADLKPAPGHALPVKPMMARRTPTAQDLLSPPTYARPDRIDELIRRSQPRAADPFDLPPPTGGPATPEPAGSQPAPVTNNNSVTRGE